MKNKIIIILLLLFSINIILADILETNKSLCDTCEKKIYVNFESTSFIKNNEYFHHFTKGYTGIGFFIKPTIEYYLTKNTKANLGIYLLKYSGVDNFTQSIPIFTIQHKLTKNTDLIFGNIYGTLDHKLEEPIFRFDTYYQKNIEYGLQLLHNSKYLQSDIWMNWEKFIFHNSPFQEEIVAGTNTNITFSPNNKFNITLPLQTLISHEGGQIDTVDDPAVSIFNGATGVKFNYSLNKNSIVNLEILKLWFDGWNLPDSGVNSQIFKNGNGFYTKLNFENKFLTLMIGYWTAEKFIAPKGEYLFQSVSDFNDTYSQIKRELITTKFAIKKEVTNSFKIQFGFDGYYDLVNNNFDFSYSLYFVIDESFFIR